MWRKRLRNLIIFIMLAALVFVPRPVWGIVERTRAEQAAAAGEYKQAAAAFEQAAERLPWQGELWEKAGEAFLQAKAYADAEADYARAEAQGALSITGQMHRGDAAMAMDEPEAAVRLWKQALEHGGDPAALNLRLAHGYQALSDFSGEAQAWQEYLTLVPKNSEALYRYGLLLAASSPEKALPELVKAGELDPDLDASVQDLRTALNTALLSDNPAYRLVVAGQSLGAQGHWDLATWAFQNAVTANPGYAEAWAWLGEAKQQAGGDGTHEIDIARSMNPKSALVQSLYGVYLQRQKQPVLALNAFLTAANLEPDNPAWQMALGRAYELTDDLVEALAHYQRATALASKDASTWRALAEFSLRDSVDLSGVGLPAANRLADLAPKDWRSFDIEGQLAFETGDMGSAEAILNKAVALDPTQAAPLLHLGILYLARGERAKAFAHLTVARDFDPNGPSGWQARRLLEEFFP